MSCSVCAAERPWNTSLSALENPCYSLLPTFCMHTFRPRLCSPFLGVRHDRGKISHGTGISRLRGPSTKFAGTRP